MDYCRVSLSAPLFQAVAAALRPLIDSFFLLMGKQEALRQMKKLLKHSRSLE